MAEITVTVPRRIALEKARSTDWAAAANILNGVSTTGDLIDSNIRVLDANVFAGGALPLISQTKLAYDKRVPITLEAAQLSLGTPTEDLIGVHKVIRLKNGDGIFWQCILPAATVMDVTQPVRVWLDYKMSNVLGGTVTLQLLANLNGSALAVVTETITVPSHVNPTYFEGTTLLIPAVSLVANAIVVFDVRRIAGGTATGDLMIINHGFSYNGRG